LVPALQLPAGSVGGQGGQLGLGGGALGGEGRAAHADQDGEAVDRGPLAGAGGGAIQALEAVGAGGFLCSRVVEDAMVDLLTRGQG